jgi:hypothetical protein
LTLYIADLQDGSEVMLKSFFGNKKTGKKQLESFEKANERDVNEDFGNVPEKIVTDPYIQHAWVGIAVELLARNVARAKYEVLKNGKAVTDTPAAAAVRMHFCSFLMSAILPSVLLFLLSCIFCTSLYAPCL